jgi:hypothetical protein
MKMASKFKKANAEACMRALAGLHMACVEASVTSKLMRDRDRARAKGEAYLQCMRMFKYQLGIELVPYEDSTNDEMVRYAMADVALGG